MRKSRLLRRIDARTVQINQDMSQHQAKHPLYSNLEQNKQRLDAIYSSCSDFIIRSFPVGEKNQAIIFISMD